MFQVGDLIKDYEYDEVAFIININNAYGSYSYYTLNNPNEIYTIDMHEAHILCHLVQR